MLAEWKSGNGRYSEKSKTLALWTDIEIQLKTSAVVLKLTEVSEMKIGKRKKFGEAQKCRLFLPISRLKLETSVVVVVAVALTTLSFISQVGLINIFLLIFEGLTRIRSLSTSLLSITIGYPSKWKFLRNVARFWPSYLLIRRKAKYVYIWYFRFTDWGNDRRWLKHQITRSHCENTFLISFAVKVSNLALFI